MYRQRIKSKTVSAAACNPERLGEHFLFVLHVMVRFYSSRCRVIAAILSGMKMNWYLEYVNYYGNKTVTPMGVGCAPTMEQRLLIEFASGILIEVLDSLLRGPFEVKAQCNCECHDEAE